MTIPGVTPHLTPIAAAINLEIESRFLNDLRIQVSVNLFLAYSWLAPHVG